MPERLHGTVAFAAYHHDQEDKNIHEKKSVRLPLNKNELHKVLYSTTSHQDGLEAAEADKKHNKKYHVVLEHCGCDKEWCRWAKWKEDGRNGPEPKHRKRAGWGPHEKGDTTHQGYLYGSKLLNAFFALCLKGGNNYWTPEGMNDLCHGMLSQRNEAMMIKDKKRNDKDSDHTRTPSFRQRNAATSSETNGGKMVHALVLEEQLHIEAGFFMEKQLKQMEEEVKELVDKRQTKEERGARKIRQQAVKTSWHGASVKSTLISYFGQGGGYAALHAGDLIT